MVLAAGALVWALAACGPTSKVTAVAEISRLAAVAVKKERFFIHAPEGASIDIERV